VPEVLRLCDIARADIAALLERLGLSLDIVAPGQAIPGSYWGEAEAGLLGHRLYARADSPVHSVLHEASHYACMDEQRRRTLNTDAGGDVLEECAVCVLQVWLADMLPGVGRDRMLADMDAWGYSFRLGSAARWWATDADDGRRWLAAHVSLPVRAPVAGVLADA
jgi:hypothetical protein